VKELIILIFIFIFIALIISCARKDSDKGNVGQFEGAFSYEKRVLLDMIDILKRYNARILEAATTEEMTRANEEFSDKLEIFNPEIIFVTKKHPDWGENPPEEMKTIIEEYLKANEEFNAISMDLVKIKVQAHPDDEKFIRSYERLKYITTHEKEGDSDGDGDSDGGDADKSDG